jgi:triosephosphate isomerase
MRLIGGNWKLNPSTLPEAELLAESIRLPQEEVETVLFPPVAFLEELAKKSPKFRWGAQDFFHKDTGAFTGEISLPMLRSIGAAWVLTGHSDRRIKFSESDKTVSEKLRAALRENFSVILCVGELERGSEGALEESLKQSTKGVHHDELARLTICYEPVWAISTSPNAEADSPEHAEEIISRLKEIIPTRWIYGGSVTSANAAAFLSMPSIEGALVGGAALKGEEFSKILEIASQ